MDAWYKANREVWHEGYGPAVATDFISRYEEDFSYMKEIGLNCYRTSLNWSRFLTDYEDAVVDLFVKYAVKAFGRFGDCVKYWFAFNEPVVVQTRVYLDGLRWPFHRDSKGAGRSTPRSSTTLPCA